LHDDGGSKTAQDMFLFAGNARVMGSSRLQYAPQHDEHSPGYLRCRVTSWLRLSSEKIRSIEVALRGYSIVDQRSSYARRWPRYVVFNDRGLFRFLGIRRVVAGQPYGRVFDGAAFRLFGEGALRECRETSEVVEKATTPVLVTASFSAVRRAPSSVRQAIGAPALN
jgi:hypothetical protein